MDDVAKIVLSMDSVIGIDLKEKIFGKSSSLVKLEHDGKIISPQSLIRVFDGFALLQNYVIADDMVNFFVKEFNLILELENQQSKARKQKLLSQGYRVVHFKQQMKWEVFLNRLLHGLFKSNGAMISEPQSVGLGMPVRD